MNRFIVAEVTKNWDGDTDISSELLSQKFELVINVNAERGYKLIDWKLTSLSDVNLLTETIIAIFELENETPLHNLQNPYLPW
jgi:hypothetical protein